MLIDRSHPKCNCEKRCWSHLHRLGYRSQTPYWIYSCQNTEWANKHQTLHKVKQIEFYKCNWVVGMSANNANVRQQIRWHIGGRAWRVTASYPSPFGYVISSDMQHDCICCLEYIKYMCHLDGNLTELRGSTVLFQKLPPRICIFVYSFNNNILLWFLLYHVHCVALPMYF